MASLTSCLKKAGQFLHPEDRAAILTVAQESRSGGMKAGEAGRAAVQAQLDAIAKLLADAEQAQKDAAQAMLAPPAGTGVLDQSAHNGGYETDLFGNPLPEAQRSSRRARSAAPAVPGNAQPEPGLPGDTPAPQGDYSVRTTVGVQAQRKLGSTVIKTAADAAAATRYLYRSAVERFDGIVTDKDGKPLAVIGGFKGALAQAAVYPSTLIGEAVRIPGAARVWLSHNHPSGGASLSRADKHLNATLADAFRGSGIEPMGLLAIGASQYSHVDANGAGDAIHDLPDSKGETTVNAIERELAPGANPARPAINSPTDAMTQAAAYYKQAQAPGILLLDSQHRVSAWVPLPTEAMGALRDTGGLNAIYRAVSEANAGAALIVHGGELDAKVPGKSVTLGENIGAALAKLDVRALDIINAKDGTSAAQQGRKTMDGPLYQGESTPRAQITLPASFTSGPAIISLLEDADLSSFIHESGHLFLEVQADLAARIQQQIDSGASVTDLERGIVADMAKLRDWFASQDHAAAMAQIEANVNAAEEAAKADPRKAEQARVMREALEWANERGRDGYLKDVAQSWGAEVPAQYRLMLLTPYHEWFARGFEAYSMEGKAPSIDLQNVFGRFRSWLLQVYKTLRGLNVTLTDDVRAVMGRMLATDQAIEEAEAQRNMGPLFKDAETAGMTLEEFNAYQALAQRSTDTAAQALQLRGMKDMKWLSRARDKALKARQAEVDQQRRDIRQEVRAEVYSEPIYRAWQFLTGKGQSDETATGGKAKAVKGLDVTADSLLVAIAKLGGINRDSAFRDAGLTADDAKIKSGVFGAPVFRKEGGLTADDMREALTENGYLTNFDEFGRTDLRELADAIADEIGGAPRYSVSYDYAQAMGSQVEALPPEMRYGKLNTEALRQQYGTGENAIWRKLSAMRMTSETGIDSDIVAETFGFDSGDALVKALAEAIPPREAIEARTDQRMLEMFGDITSPEALARAADEAVHNEARARFIASELKALQAANKVRGEGKNALYGRSSVDVMAKAAEQYANQIIARLKVSDIRPAQYAAAEARSAKLAEKALAAGKMEEAALHKRNQLVNNYATKAAYQALDDIKAAQVFFRKVNGGNSDEVAKTRDFSTVQVARAILAEYGLGTKGKSAGEYLETVKANDPDLHTVLSERVAVMTSAAQPFKDMPVENLRGLHDEIRSLWQMAKRSRQIEIDGVMVDKARATLAVRERLEAIGIPDRMPGEGMAVTEDERRVTKLRTLWAALRRVESWVDSKDGGTPGPFRRYVWQPVRDAADRYRVDKAKFLKQYRALLDGLDLGRSRIDAPELGYVFGASRGGSGKQEILHAILHIGNESNKRKLLLGRKWAMENEDGTLDTSRWDRFVQRMIDQGVLGKAEYDFAQGVWDLLESTKPLAQKAHRDVFGRYFDEVTADAFTTPFGTYRGGYVPAMADPEVVTDAKTRAFIEAESQTLAHAFPSTAKGFTKARVEYNRALLLDLRSLAQHIDKVLLFSHLEQPIRDVRKVLADKDVAEPLHRVDPTAFDSLLTPWLNRAARQSVEQPVPGDNGLMRFWTKARSRAGLAAMFANVSNTAQQITGLSIAAVKVKPKHLLAASAQWISAPRQTAQAVAAASSYMATRMDNEVAQMTDAINDILLNPNVYEKAQTWTAKHAYFMQSAVDNCIGPIVWQGAYNQALEAGENERDAVRLADAAVRQTQGSTLPEDVAWFESGNSFVRMFTQFAGYFNMQANLLGTEFANGMRQLGLRRGMGRGLYVFTLGFLVPALVSELIVQAFRGGPDDEDKDGEFLDDWLAALGMGTLRSGLAMVPVAGQLGGAIVNSFNAKPYDDRISTAPAISMIESATVGVGSDVYHLITTGEVNAKKTVRDVATLITMTTGLPATAVARPVGYMADVAQGRVQPTSGADMARGLVTGVASPESKR